MQEARVWSLSWQDPLKKETATRSSILAWRIRGRRSAAGYSPGGRRAGRDSLAKHTRCVTNPCAAQWASLFTRPPYSSVLGSWQTPSPALPQLLSPLASSLFSRSVSPFLFCEVKRSESRSVVSDCLQPRGLYRARNSLGQNTGVGGLPLLQGTFPGTEDKFIPVIF